ncbi:COQ9 protein [Phytophthora cactorum]|nr:COQ9 protein [Phytophthora cactorum]
MASRSLIRRSVRLTTVATSKRSVVRAASVSVMSRQCFQTAPATPQIRLQSTQATSSEESPKTESPVDPEQPILAKAIDHVTMHGWTIEALAAGATDLGYPSVAHGMFPRGSVELVEYFMDSCLAKLRKTLIVNTEKLQAMTVAERLKFGVRTRLEMLEPVLATWPQGMAIGALPQNAPSTAKRLAKLSDEIWYFAGDKSTDLSWYTKRAILTGHVGILGPPCGRNDPAGRAAPEPERCGRNGQYWSAVGVFGCDVSRGSSGSSDHLELASEPSAEPDFGCGKRSSPSVVSAVASGIPFNGSASMGTPGHDDMAFKSKDLDEINAELEKLGGTDASERRS